MSDFSVYYRNQIINHMLRNQAFTPPATLYVALFKSSNGLSDNNGATIQEVDGGGYARQAVTLSAASGGDSANSADVNFPAATTDWGTITHVGLVTHATNTGWNTNVHVIMWDNLRNSIGDPVTKSVLETDVLKIVSGKLEIEVR